jgi:hypothetical protein
MLAVEDRAQELREALAHREPEDSFYEVLLQSLETSTIQNKLHSHALFTTCGAMR